MSKEQGSRQNRERGETEHAACVSWIPTAVDFETVDATGRSLTLHGVPAQSCVVCGNVRVSPDDVLKAEQVDASTRSAISPIEGNILLFLHAPLPYFTKQPGEIRERYRFNKMLFYHWAELDKVGLGHARIHDSFTSAKRGPVPDHIDETCKSLESKGLIDVQWGGKAAKRPFVYQLTAKGREVAEQLWALTPDPVKDSFTRAKFELMTLDRFEIRDKVHREYPQFRKTYTEPEAEA